MRSELHILLIVGSEPTKQTVYRHKIIAESASLRLFFPVFFVLNFFQMFLKDQIDVLAEVPVVGVS